jgi:hypothetical protein
MLYRGKMSVITGLDRAMQAGRLAVASKQPLAPILLDEIKSLRGKVSKAGRLLVDEPDPQYARFDDLVMCCGQGLAISEYFWTPSNKRRWEGLRPRNLQTDRDGVVPA